MSYKRSHNDIIKEWSFLYRAPYEKFRHILDPQPRYLKKLLTPNKVIFFTILHPGHHQLCSQKSVVSPVVDERAKVLKRTFIAFAGS